MLVIGVAGGVASGKSLVTRCLIHLGAASIDADKLGHNVLRETEVIDQIASIWGLSLLVDGQIDRKQLGAIVFAPGLKGKQHLAQLEQITHPRIGKAIQSRLDELKRQSVPAVVLDAPVMFKAGWDLLCDEIVFVEVPLEVRQKRADSRGWEPGELARREQRQTSLRDKREAATSVIDNSGSKASTFQQVLALWRSWALPVDSNLGPPHDLLT